MTCEKYDRLTLLSYLAGDLSESGGPEVSIHLQECERCAAFVREARREQETFLREFPSVPRPAGPEKKMLRFTPLRTVLPLAAALLLAVGTGVVLFNGRTSDTRIKGAVELQPFVLDRGGKVVLRESRVFFPGERIQFTYACGKEQYLILMSVDTSGRVSVFYPAHGDSSIHLVPGRGLPLEHSILLDDYIGKELFIGLFSAHSLHTASIVDEVKRAVVAADDLHAVDLKIGGAQVQLVPVLKKERPR